MRRNVLLAVLLVGGVVAGAFAYRAQAQQTLTPTDEQRILQRQRAISQSQLLVADAAAGQPQQAPAAAPAPAPVQPPGPVYVVTFVDITPNNRDNGTAICKEYAAAARRMPGVTSVQLLAQTNRPNHLVLYEVFENQAAFDRHEALQQTKDFRGKMAPIIGSPFDQRPHYVVP